MLKLKGKYPAIAIFICGAVLSCTAGCASTSEREKTLLVSSAKESPKFEELLVLPEQYTTSGVVYHKKYHKCLTAIAAVLTEEHKLTVLPHSIGFYYDKRENVKDKLYLGIDISVPLDASYKFSSYEGIAVAILENYLKDILTVVHSCTSVFTESEILGTVIGFKWDNGGRAESINIWIDKRDVTRFENMQLTLKELISKSAITNTSGKLIRLLL